MDYISQSEIDFFIEHIRESILRELGSKTYFFFVFINNNHVLNPLIFFFFL